MRISVMNVEQILANDKEENNMKHITGFILLFVGGILMIISSTVGSIKVFDFLYNIVVNQWPQYQQIASIILTILQWIADLGGVAIIVGAFFILIGGVRIGKFIIWIGLAFGTFALIIWLASQIVNLTGIITDPTIISYINQLYAQFNYGSGLSFLGVVLAIFGRAFVRKVKGKKITEEEKEDGTMDSFETEDLYEDD